MKLIRLVPVFLLLLDGCIEKFDVPDLQSKVSLIVDGEITDKPGPYTVKLFRPGPEGSSELTPVSNANVTIHDDTGNSTLLTEKSSGVYETTPALVGEVGRSYKVVINTQDDKIYESDFQQMMPAGQIDNVYAQFFENIINDTEITKPQDAFRVYVDAKGTQGATNLFRWRWTSVYEYRTYPEHRKKKTNTGVIRDPFPCSGYTVNENGFVQVGKCGCCNCWTNEEGSTAIVSDNQFVNETTFNKVMVAQVPIEEFKFYSKYYIKIEQLSLSPEVYSFWKRVQTQQQSGGDIFQPNVIKIEGNIKCTSHPQEEVAGIFGVSAVTTNDIFLKRTDIPKAVGVDSVINDCRLVFPDATAVKPDFW